jgi:hypothetical protein
LLALGPSFMQFRIVHVGHVYWELRGVDVQGGKQVADLHARVTVHMSEECRRLHSLEA